MIDHTNISLLICTRNRTHALDKCLESINNGTLQPMEIIIVDQSDDSSTEEMINTARLRSLSTIYYIKLTKAGLTKARNIGLNEAHGEIVVFTDDDCIAGPFWLENLMVEFNSHDASCVCGCTMPFDHIERLSPMLISTLRCKTHKFIKGKQNPNSIGKGNNMAFKRDIILGLGGFNEFTGVGTPLEAGDDSDIFYRLLEADHTIIYTPYAVIYHSQPDEQETILNKKFGYAVSASALMSAKALSGDFFAAALLIGKILYELLWLLCGGLIRFKWNIITIGWYSLMGSLYGLRYIFNRSFRKEVNRLTQLTRKPHVPPVNTIPDSIKVD